MIPLKDRVLRRRFPFINVLLILLNLVLFFFEWSLPQPLLETFINDWGFVPARFFAGDMDWSRESLTPLVSSMYLHGGWFHVISNMLTLWIFGDNVEDRMGHARYFAFYTLCGLTATLTHSALYPTSPLPVIGASGAIAGVLGAYLLLFPRARVVTVIPLFLLFFVRDIPAFLFISFWFVSQLFNGVAALAPSMSGSGIAWWAHIGGFSLGLLLAIPLGGKQRAYLPADAFPSHRV